MAPEPGERLLHYVVERRLGEGGMGEVWLGRDTRLDRPVALKFLSRAALGDPEARARLVREARAASALAHPNILTIYAVEQSDGRDFIAMEYVDGETLDAWAAREPRGTDALLDVALQVGEGLAAAHARGVVHRDVKPGNVMVSGGGRVQVMDFGLARVSSEPQLTRTGSTVGTLAYMSPEQVKGLVVDARSDVFAFGALCWELFAGASPFAREAGVAAVLHAILEDDPPPVSSRRADAPPGLDGVLARALAKDRDARYPSLAPMLDDLRTLRSGSAPAVPVPAPTRRPGSFAAAAVVAAALLVGAWALLGRGAEPDGPPEYAPRLVALPGPSPHSATFSPDASQVAYVRAVDGVDQLFVTGLDEGEPRQLTSGARAVVRPRWSPVGNEILYHHPSEGTGWQEDGELLAVSSLGGEPRRVLAACRNASWSSDGERIVFEREGRLWTARPDGTEERVLDGLPRARNLQVRQMPALSPDGARVVFFRSVLGPMGRLWIAGLDGSGLRPLAPGLDMARDPSFTPDGRGVVYSSDRGGSRTLWRVSTEPGADAAPQAITTGAGEDSQPCLSRDGRRIVFTNARNEFVLQAWDPSTPPSARRVLRSVRTEVLCPTWSPDGESLAAFGVGRQPGSHLLVYADGASDALQVTRGTAALAIYPRWSADGEWLYYFEEQESGSSFRRIPARGGASQEVVAGWTMQTHPFPSLSPDGRRALVTEVLEDGWLRGIDLDLETLEQREFPVPLFRPAWSPDGTRLVGEWPPGQIARVDLPAETRVKLGPGQVGTFAPDGRSIYYLEPRDDGWYLGTMDLDGGGRTTLLRLGHMFEQAPAYDVSRSGEVVWSEFRPGPRELWLLEER